MVIRVRWEVDGVGGGEAHAVSMDVVPGAIEQIISESLRRYAPGVVASTLGRMLAPIVGMHLADVRRGLADTGRWEFKAEGFKLVVVEDADT